MDMSTLEGGLPLITILAHFNPRQPGGDHSFIQVQFNETHPSSIPFKKGEKK
jgi:hypothetical protein